jgi:hypothetical protein
MPAPQVRKELAPWEAQMQEVQGRMEIATSERDLLLRKSEEAKVGRGEWGQPSEGPLEPPAGWAAHCKSARRAKPLPCYQPLAPAHRTPSCLRPPSQGRLEAARAQLVAARKAAEDKGREIGAIEKEMVQARCDKREGQAGTAGAQKPRLAWACALISLGLMPPVPCKASRSHPCPALPRPRPVLRPPPQGGRQEGARAAGGERQDRGRA